MKPLALFISLILGLNSADASEMVKVPAGEFIMGDNADGYASPKKTAQLEAFFIDRFEVTNEEFRQQFSDHTFWKGFEPHPVTNITWYQAETYCERVGKRLPTEEEWEKAHSRWALEPSLGLRIR